MRLFLALPFNGVVADPQSHVNVLFQPNTVHKLLTVAPDDAVKNLTAVYLYNCSSSLRQYAKYNERHLAPLKVALQTLFCLRTGDRE